MKLTAPIKNAFFRFYVKLMELFGWGYWAYYPKKDRLIWTRKQCQIYGVQCETKVKVGEYAMFDRCVLNDAFREHSRYAVEMSMKTHADFRQQFPVRHQTTEEIIFIEARGEWVFDERGEPFCLHGFNRKITFPEKEFEPKLNQLTMSCIVGEWKRDGKVPDSFFPHGTARS